MKAYTIIDKNERNAQSECVLYTFKELKELFKPEEDLLINYIYCVIILLIIKYKIYTR